MLLWFIITNQIYHPSRWFTESLVFPAKGVKMGAFSFANHAKYIIELLFSWQNTKKSHQLFITRMGVSMR